MKGKKVVQAAGFVIGTIAILPLFPTILLLHLFKALHGEDQAARGLVRPATRRLTMKTELRTVLGIGVCVLALVAGSTAGHAHQPPAAQISSHTLCDGRTSVKSKAETTAGVDTPSAPKQTRVEDPGQIKWPPILHWLDVDPRLLARVSRLA